MRRSIICHTDAAGFHSAHWYRLNELDKNVGGLRAIQLVIDLVVIWPRIECEELVQVREKSGVVSEFRRARPEELFEALRAQEVPHAPFDLPARVDGSDDIAPTEPPKHLHEEVIDGVLEAAVPVEPQITLRHILERKLAREYYRALRESIRAVEIAAHECFDIGRVVGKEA